MRPQVVLMTCASKLSMAEGATASYVLVNGAIETLLKEIMSALAHYHQQLRLVLLQEGQMHSASIWHVR